MYELRYGRRVKYIEADQGSEFNNYLVQNYLQNPYDDNNEIKIIYSDAGDKNKMDKIERFNRTVKEKLLPILRAKFLGKERNKLNYKDIVSLIESVIRNYNLIKHSSTRRIPQYFNEKDNLYEWLNQKMKTIYVKN